LLISGSLRDGSTNTALLRTAMHLEVPGIVTVLYDEMGALPHFNPDLDAAPLPAAVDRLRTAIHSADAVLLSTPEYAGALPGSFRTFSTGESSEQRYFGHLTAGGIRSSRSSQGELIVSGSG
jgi:NAD(P)H-dependent FMN reductase